MQFWAIITLNCNFQNFLDNASHHQKGRLWFGNQYVVIKGNSPTDFDVHIEKKGQRSNWESNADSLKRLTAMVRCLVNQERKIAN